MNKKLQIWVSKCNDNINYCHRILTTLMQDFDSLLDDPGMSEPPNSSSVIFNESKPLPDLSQEFISKCQSTIDLLNVPLEGNIKLPLGLIMKLIHRCLHIPYQRVLPSNKDLAEQIPLMFDSALKLLIEMVRVCGSILLPYNKRILSLFKHIYCL